tara:strand:+ start:1103 stop:1402 length:300 start_codon:yes stop_codon:yes gene_type:complete
MGRPCKYKQKTIDAVHQMVENGKTIKQTMKHLKLSRHQVTYVLYQKDPSENVKMPYGYENKFNPTEPTEVQDQWWQKELTEGYGESFQKFLKRFTAWLS